MSDAALTPGPATHPVSPDDDVTPAELLLALRRLSGRWQGLRTPAAPFLTLSRPLGAHVPIVWIFQTEAEFRTLAEALPSDQPLGGFKSVYMGGAGFSDPAMMRHFDPSHLEPVSDAYLADVRTVLGGRPYVLGGNCSGAVTALDMALRSTRPPDMLVLMNYPLAPRPYAGPARLIFGAGEWAEFQARPGAAAAHPGAPVALLTAAHGAYFGAASIAELAGMLAASAAGVAMAAV